MDVAPAMEKIKEGMDQTMEGKCVLVTGVTGFIGKVIVEKLLYEFPNLKCVYIMMRGKKARPPKVPHDISPTERFESDVLNSPIWSLRLRLEGEEEDAFRQRIKTRVKAFEGSLGRARCSISDADWAELSTEVDSIIHCAASVNFNDHLCEQVATNVVGASELIRLLDGPGRDGRQRTFVHVSTCYVGFPKGTTINKIKRGIRGEVTEGPCVFDHDPEELLQFISKPENRDMVTTRQPSLLRDAGHRNTYTFSKAMAETLLSARCMAAPETSPKLVIVRPSCVGSAASEPCCGWVDAATANGAMFLFAILGYLKYFPGWSQAISDQIPVDYVANACIIAQAYAPFDTGVPIRQIHVGSSAGANPVTWGETGKWIAWTAGILNYHANPRKLQLKAPSGWYFVQVSRRRSFFPFPPNDEHYAAASSPPFAPFAPFLVVGAATAVF